MPTIISKVEGRYQIEFDAGSFDQHCVYLKKQSQLRYAPRDTEYFTFLKQMAKKYGKNTIYDDFREVFRNTTKTLDPSVILKISELSKKYTEDAEDIAIWLTVIYGGMIAEENKANTKLGKRIKRLGVHQILFEDVAPEIAANFSKGKKWRDLDALMTERGF